MHELLKEWQGTSLLERGGEPACGQWKSYPTPGAVSGRDQRYATGIMAKDDRSPEAWTIIIQDDIAVSRGSSG